MGAVSVLEPEPSGVDTAAWGLPIYSLISARLTPWLHSCAALPASWPAVKSDTAGSRFRGHASGPRLSKIGYYLLDNIFRLRLSYFQRAVNFKVSG